MFSQFDPEILDMILSPQNVDLYDYVRVSMTCKRLHELREKKYGDMYQFYCEGCGDNNWGAEKGKCTNCLATCEMCPREGSCHLFVEREDREMPNFRVCRAGCLRFCIECGKWLKGHHYRYLHDSVKMESIEVDNNCVEIKVDYRNAQSYCRKCSEGKVTWNVLLGVVSKDPHKGAEDIWLEEEKAKMKK